jgi:phosphoserine phosphatase
MASPPNSLVATLIANPSQPVLTDDVVAMAAEALGQETERSVLARGIAADLIVPAPADPKAVEALLRSVLGSRPIDVVVQPLGQRRKRLFLADMDSTMHGEVAFEPALRERVALLKGLLAEVIGEIIEQRITLTPGGRSLVRTIRAHGGYACLVSGGFTLFTGPVAARIGFDEHRANRLILKGGRLAGLVEEPILGREAKLATLLELRQRLGLAAHETMAVGDGANDLAMLGEAGLGVAFRAKPAVAAAAHARLDHADLSALLYVQGYRAEEIVGA